MAQLPFRVNIQSSIFPLLSELMGDDVILDKGDQTFVPDYNPASSVAPVEKGVAQVMYCHNVMPSTYGYQSIGFSPQYSRLLRENVYFDSAKLVISEEGTRTYIGIDYIEGGKLYALRSSGEWILPEESPDLEEQNIVTVATINGVSYIAASGLGVWTYSIANEKFTKIELNGIEDEGIKGILQASGYLIVWSDTGVAWSAVDDPLDFEPSDISGAGAGELQEATGKITFCQQTAYGAIIFTENNAVSMTWSGNTNYPFNFKAIPGAGGASGGEVVTRETVNAVYAYTTNGMQQVYHTGAKTALSYVTDFIAGQVLEDFDELNNVLIISSFTGTMKKKLTLVNDRYLVLSYGMDRSEPYTHALILDLSQTRMGKIKFEHTDVFELRNISPETIEIPRESIALLKVDGSVYTVDFGLRNVEAFGVMILGRYRLLRSNLTTVNSVRFENVLANTGFKCYAYRHIKSKKLINPEALSDDLTIPRDAGLRDFYGEVTGETVSLLIKGTFNINTVILTVTPDGVL